MVPADVTRMTWGKGLGGSWITCISGGKFPGFDKVVSIHSHTVLVLQQHCNLNELESFSYLTHCCNLCFFLLLPGFSRQHRCHQLQLRRKYRNQSPCTASPCQLWQFSVHLAQTLEWRMGKIVLQKTNRSVALQWESTGSLNHANWWDLSTSCKWEDK